MSAQPAKEQPKTTADSPELELNLLKTSESNFEVVMARDLEKLSEKAKELQKKHKFTREEAAKLSGMLATNKELTVDSFKASMDEAAKLIPDGPDKRYATFLIAQQSSWSPKTVPETYALYKQIKEDHKVPTGAAAILLYQQLRGDGDIEKYVAEFKEQKRNDSESAGFCGMWKTIAHVRGLISDEDLQQIEEKAPKAELSFLVQYSLKLSAEEVLHYLDQIKRFSSKYKIPGDIVGNTVVYNKKKVEEELERQRKMLEHSPLSPPAHDIENN